MLSYAQEIEMDRRKHLVCKNLTFVMQYSQEVEVLEELKMFLRSKESDKTKEAEWKREVVA